MKLENKISDYIFKFRKDDIFKMPGKFIYGSQPVMKTTLVSVTHRVRWTGRHVWDDAIFHLRWKSGDSCWLWKSGYLQISPQSIWTQEELEYGVVSLKAWSITVITQSSALFLGSRSFSLQTQSLWKLPSLWADCLGSGNLQGAIFKHAHPRTLLNILNRTHLSLLKLKQEGAPQREDFRL